MLSNEKIISRSKEPINELTIPLKYKVGQEVRYIITFYDFARCTRGTGIIESVRLKLSNSWPNAYYVEYKINSRWRNSSDITGLVHNVNLEE